MSCKGGGTMLDGLPLIDAGNAHKVYRLNNEGSTL